MDFLLFMGEKEKEILELIYKAQFSVEENTPLCLLGDQFFGFLKKEQKRVVICTNNAKKMGGYNFPKALSDEESHTTKILVRRAIRHEAVHVAQMCNNGNILDLTKQENIKLHPFKKGALKGSTRISGSKEKEREAYWMEDRPRQVIYALKKYCLKKTN